MTLPGSEELPLLDPLHGERWTLLRVGPASQPCLGTRCDRPTKGAHTMPRVYYLVEEMTFHAEEGSRRRQVETLLTQRGEEGWELVSMMTPEAHTEETPAGLRVIRTANLLLVFKRL